MNHCPGAAAPLASPHLSSHDSLFRSLPSFLLGIPSSRPFSFLWPTGGFLRQVLHRPHQWALRVHGRDRLQSLRRRPTHCGRRAGHAVRDALGPSGSVRRARAQLRGICAGIFAWRVGALHLGDRAACRGAGEHDGCTYAGQIIMGGCLQIQLAPWKRVAFTRAIALVPALLVAVSTGSDTSLFNNINEYLNVLQSVQLPFAMLPVLHFAANKKVMGRFASSPSSLRSPAPSRCS